MPEFSQQQLQNYWDMAVDLTIAYVPKLLLALIVLLIGLWLIKRATNLMVAGLETAGIDESLAKFLRSLVSMALKVLLLISVASMVGIATTSFVAVLGAAGLAIGLALQGSLANFAGGVLILLFKPFKVGDFIEAQGVMGTVREIQIFSSLIHTTDNKVVIVPNGKLSNDVITNYSREATRRVDLLFGIGYESDISRAKSLIDELIQADKRIHKDPEPLIVVSELAGSSVNLTVRVWTDSSDMWDVRFELLETVKLAFDANGISIPYPQRDIRIISGEPPPP